MVEFTPVTIYAPAKSTHVSQPVVSVVLDPEFCTELRGNAKAFDASQEDADNSQWEMAALVNGMWSEHKGQFENKNQYYAECSRVANIGLKHKRLSDSGETLRRWCEVQAFYAPFSWAAQLLDKLTFSHLLTNKKLHKDGKVKSVLEALERAVKEKWTSDEMKEHFDPSLPVHPYDMVQGHLASLMSKDNWQFIKSKEALDYCLTRIKEVDLKIREELEKEGKAHEQHN